MKPITFHLSICLFLLGTLLQADTCRALTPEEVVVIANKMAWHSCDLAKYYMKKRGIPAENLVELKGPDKEHCSREEYDKHIATPVRAFLKKNDPKGERFRCLVTMYGVPLRINASGNPKISQGAAVDSELALVREEHYSLEGWLPNKFFFGYRGKKIEGMPQNAIMVSRLDGPSEAIVRRVIDDSTQIEKQGLNGTAYFDARWPDPGDKKLEGYAYYDRAIHNAARLIQKSKRMPAVVDSDQKLFEAGQCPNAALYCGWYSLSRYVDAFTWARGAVGFHIASGECTTLKGGQAWCKMMLEKGVAATVGPVAEPYVQAFPIPDLFFALLLEGDLTLAECYALSNPFWSWQMVLIGDPLYRPFQKIEGGQVGR